MKETVTSVVIVIFVLFGTQASSGQEIGNCKIPVDGKLSVGEPKIREEMKAVKEANARNEKVFNKEMTELKLALKETTFLAQSNEKRVSGYLFLVGLFTGILFGLVTLVLGIGVIKIYIDHKGMIEKIDRQLDERFKEWWDNKGEEINGLCLSMSNDLEKELQNFSYFLKLKMLLVQGDVNAEEIYPLVAPLSEEPIITYKPVFEKLADLNIDEDITKKANEGLEKL